MQIVVWIAVAVFATPAGPDTAMSDPFKTEAECREMVVKMDKVADEHPEVLALGQSCVSVTVVPRAAKPAPKMSVPTPNQLGDNGVRTL